MSKSMKKSNETSGRSIRPVVDGAGFGLLPPPFSPYGEDGTGEWESMCKNGTGKAVLPFATPDGDRVPALPWKGDVNGYRRSVGNIGESRDLPHAHRPGVLEMI